MGRNCDLEPILDDWQRRLDRGTWGGWADADTGLWTWRLKSNYPIVSGVTPTADGGVFIGDQAIILEKWDLHA